MRTVGSYLKMVRKRDCTRSKAHHRVEVGQDEERAFKRKQILVFFFLFGSKKL